MTETKTEGVDPDLLEQWIHDGDLEHLRRCVAELPSAEASYVLSRLKESDREALVSSLSAEDAAELLLDLPPEQAADVIEQLDPSTVAAIADQLPDDEVADLLADVHQAETEAILDALPAETAEHTRVIMSYPADSAGGLMDTAFLAFDETLTVGDVLTDMERNRETYADFEVQYAYVVHDAGMLRGVLRLRDLVLSSRTQPIREIMIPNPHWVAVDANLDALIALFDDHGFIGAPVLDGDQRLVGVIQRTDVSEATENREKNSFLKISGIIGGEEFRSMPLLNRAFRRLAWLGPNIILNMLAASVIAMHQETLQAAIALAVFLPIISDMSGCSGNQAVAVSIRELSLGLIKPGEFARIFSKEAALGIINGLLLGLALGAVAYVWKGNLVLAGVVAGALMLNTMLSVLLGGSVPLLLRGLKIDPALASGPILTTVTDMCGFFLVLSLASSVLDKL